MTTKRDHSHLLSIDDPLNNNPQSMKLYFHLLLVWTAMSIYSCSSVGHTQKQTLTSVTTPTSVESATDVSSQPEVNQLGKAPDEMTEEEWKSKLTPMQYSILREKGTERAYTGKHWNNDDEGTYSCAGCGTHLFTSNLKYHSGCGWPSFFDSIDPDKIKTAEDYNLGMARTEIMCAKCGGHLGHVFKDGPPPTGLRYCVNSESLSFAPKASADSVEIKK